MLTVGLILGEGRGVSTRALDPRGPPCIAGSAGVVVMSLVWLMVSF